MIGLGREVNTTSSQQIPRGYLVDKNGEIDFPVLGKLKVEGISRNELAEMLKEKLSEYLKNPIVTIQFQNFKVTILGEVKAPGSYKVVSERVSLLDALGMAGDLQINGKRKNVLVMREHDFFTCSRMMWFTWNRTKDGLPGEVSVRSCLIFYRVCRQSWP